MATSINEEKAFDELQHTFMSETLRNRRALLQPSKEYLQKTDSEHHT